MKKRNWLKIGCSVLLAVCMIAGLTLQYIPYNSKANSTVATQLQEAGYTRVTPSDFGLDGTYTGLTRGTGYENSLHMTYLDMDVSFEKVTNGNTHIRYAMDESDRGIFICGYPSGNFMIKHTSNTVENYAGTGAVQNVYSSSETKVNVKETFNLKLAVKYESATATSGTVTYSFWVNDVLVAENHTFTADGLGQNMGMFVLNTNNSITVGTPEEEQPTVDVNAQLQEAGYTRVTPGDFGLDGTYTGLTRGTGYENSLHMTYLDMDVSFEKVTNGNTHIRYAMDGSDRGIFICGYPSGNFMIKHTSNTVENYAGTGAVQNVYSPSETKVNVKETFNLKLAVKYESATATSGTVTYSFWINDALVAENHTFTADGLGQNMGMFVLNTNNSITVDSPGEEEEEQPEDVDALMAAAGYTRVTPGDFGLDGTYTGTTRGTGYENSLHMTYLDMDVSFEKVTNGNTHIRYAMDGSDRGIFICGYPSGNFMIKHTSNTVENYAGTGAVQNVYSPSETKVNVKETFNLKLAVKYESAEVTSGTVTYSFWINNVLVAKEHTFTADGLGRNMGVLVGTAGDSITVGTPGGVAPEEPLEQHTPEELGFEEITIKDFNLSAGQYKPTDAPVHTVKTYKEDTLDGKYLNANISFDMTEECGNNNALIYGSTGGWTGLRITARQTGLRIGNASNSDYIDYTFEKLGLDNITDMFNLKLGVKFGEGYTPGTSATCDVTYSLWIEDILIARDVFLYGVAGTGSQMALYRPDATITITRPKTSGDNIEKLPDYRMLTLSHFGLSDMELRYVDKAVTKADVSLFPLDGTIFSANFYFSKKRGGDFRLGGTDMYSGLWIYTDGDGNMNLYGVSQKGFETEQYTFTPFTAGTELVETWINLKVSTKIVDSDGDGVKDDVEVGMWFNDVLYDNEYIYLVDYAQYLGIRLNVFSQEAGSFIRVKNEATVDTSVDFTLFGFTKNWEKEYGLK